MSGPSAPAAAATERRLPLAAKLRWVSILYFIEGFPFGIFYDALPVYFRLHGVSLREIGLMSLLQLPWSLKVFWSPLVDRLGRPRAWITGALLVIAVSLAAIPWFEPSRLPLALWVVLAALTIASATQDIAIDGTFVRLMDKDEEGIGNGVRVSAYRAALIVGGGATVILAGTIPWEWIFLGVAGVAAAAAVVVRFAPAVERAAERPLRDWLVSLWIWLRRPSAPFVFAFILVYKLGDVAMGPMVRPFWVDRGMSPEEIGFITTTAGVLLNVAGALVGGWFTSRRGIFTGLWVLGLTQAFSNLGYAAVAHYDLGRPFLYGASAFESFTQGLGTAALLAFLTRACDREHAATQYAMLSALFGFTRTVAGAASGWATEQLGFASYFGLTFLLSFPAYGLLPWVRAWTGDEGRGAAAP